VNGGQVLGVAHTGITTSDMQRSVHFFRDILGLPVTEPILYTDRIFERVTGIRDANIRIAFVDLPGHKLELLEYVRPEQRKMSTLRSCDSGHLHLSFLVNGIEDLVQRMREGGFEPVGPIQQAEAEGTRFKVIYTIGADNLVIELMDFS